jgi:hypothetical protein
MTIIVADYTVPAMVHRKQQTTRPRTRASKIDHRYSLHMCLDTRRSGDEAITSGLGE